MHLVLPPRARLALALLLCLTSTSVVPLRAQGRSDESFQLAIGLMKRGLHDDAARQLSQFLKGSPGHRRAAEAWYRLGTCYLELQKPERAADAFENALQQGNGFQLKAECRYRLGHTLQGLGKHGEAASQFEKLVDEAGDDHYLAAASLYAAGECRRDAKQVGPALANFARAVRADKDNNGKFAGLALYQTGFVLMGEQRFKDAMVAFAEVADRYPRHKAAPESRFLEGEAGLRAKEFDRAERAYRKSLDDKQFAAQSRMGIAWCRLDRGDKDGALAEFHQLRADHGGNPLAAQAGVEAARILHGAGRYQEAIDEVADIVDNQRVAAAMRSTAFELRGLSQLELKQPAAAIKSLASALSLQPGDKDAAGDRARILFSLGEAQAEKRDWAGALAQYQKAEAQATTKELRGDAGYGQVLALHKLGRFKDSLGKSLAVLQQDSQHRLTSTVEFSVGENLFSLKQYRDADRAYELLQKKLPSDHELAEKVMFKRAWCSYLQGQYVAAAQRFAMISERKGEMAEEALSMAALAWLEGGKWTEAIETADKYRARYRDGRFLSRTERVAARVLKQRGDLRGAADRIASAAKFEKSSDRAGADLLEFSDVLFKQGDYGAAKKAYRPLAERKDEVGARAREGMAWCEYELGNDEACSSWIAKGLEHPAVGKLEAGFLELSSALHHRGKQWDKAVAAAQEFLSKYPSHERAPEMTYALGVAFARAGKLGPARKELESIAGKQGVARPDRVYYELAWVCRKLKDEPAALAAFSKVAETSEDNDLSGEGYLHVGEALLGQKKVDEARETLAKVKGRYRPRALYRIGFSWTEAGKPEQALPFFEDIVSMGPEVELYDEALFWSGECTYRAGDYKQAIPRFTKLLRKSPDGERAQTARLHLGESEVLQGGHQQAAGVLEEFVRRHQGDGSSAELARAYLWLGKARENRKELDRAEAAYKRTTEITDTELAAEAQFRIGMSRKAKNDLDSAVDAFVKLSILYGHKEWVQRGLLEAGNCYLALEQPSKARKFFEELVAKYPNSNPSTEAKAKLETIRRK